MERLITERIWKFGRPAELWARNAALIKQFIASNKLKPVSDAYLDPISLVAGGVIIDGRKLGETLAELAARSALPGKAGSSRVMEKLPFKWPIPFPGGMKSPHLHFQENIYLLNEKQWKDFSGRIIKDIQSRIANAGSVSFDQLVELTEATGGLV